VFYNEFPNIARALKSGRFTIDQVQEIKDFFEMGDGELETWLDDEGEGEVFKVFKAISSDYDEPDKKPEKEAYEYGEEVGDVGKMRDRLNSIKQLARNIQEKTLRSQIISEADAALKELGVVQKSLGYDPRTGMVESPEVRYIKAKMQSRW